MHEGQAAIELGTLLHRRPVSTEHPLEHRPTAGLEGAAGVLEERLQAPPDPIEVPAEVVRPGHVGAEVRLEVQRLDEDLDSRRYAEAVAQCGRAVAAEFGPSSLVESQGLTKSAK